MEKLVKSLLGFPLRKKLLYSVIKIVSLAIPSTFFGFLQFKYESEPSWVHTTKDFFNVHWLVFLLCFCLPTLLGILLSLWEQFAYYLKEKSSFESTELTAILRSLDEIVSYKLDRFAKCAKAIIDKPRKREEIFDEITQPDKQIEQIIGQLHNVLRILTKDDSLRIVLVKISQAEPVEIYQHMPLSSKPSFELVGELRKKTLFYHAAKDKEIKVIPNIKKHLESKSRKQAFYAPSDNESSRQGSIIAFPIQHHGNTSLPYVLTIKSDEEYKIDEGFKKKYSFIVDLFIKRICLEHSLKIIKEQKHD
jgi:hypothetical protein